MYRSLALLLLTACAAQGDLTDDGFTDELLDARTDVAAEDPGIDAGAPDLLPGLRAAAAHTREEVAQALGQDAADAMPDLVALWRSSDESDGDGALRDGPGCHPGALMGGAWTVEGPHAGDYVGAWFRPDGTLSGGVGGHFRDLARPGGQWGGFFGHDGQPLGPQGGMFDRRAERFAGLWSAPEHQGGVHGRWVRLAPEGGFFFGVIAVCPDDMGAGGEPIP